MSLKLNVQHESHLSIRNLKLDGFVPVERVGAKEERVQKLVQQLAKSEHGAQLSGMLSIAMMSMPEKHLQLIEQAIAVMETPQALFTRIRAEDIVFINNGQHRQAMRRDGRSPFASIADNVVPVFNETNLTNMVHFGDLDESTEVILHVCATLMDEGITLTKPAISRHLAAFRRVQAVKSMRSGVHISSRELVRAVERFPDKIVLMMQLLIDRGSIASLEEVVAAPNSLAEGAL